MRNLAAACRNKLDTLPTLDSNSSSVLYACIRRDDVLQQYCDLVDFNKHKEQLNNYADESLSFLRNVQPSASLWKTGFKDGEELFEFDRPSKITINPKQYDDITLDDYIQANSFKHAVQLDDPEAVARIQPIVAKVDKPAVKPSLKFYFPKIPNPKATDNVTAPQQRNNNTPSVSARKVLPEIAVTTVSITPTPVPIASTPVPIARTPVPIASTPVPIAPTPVSIAPRKRPADSSGDTAPTFSTARIELMKQNAQATGPSRPTRTFDPSKTFVRQNSMDNASSSSRRTLGIRKVAAPTAQYKPPFRQATENDTDGQAYGLPAEADSTVYADERLRGIEPRLVELVMNEIMDNGPKKNWDDISGLVYAKKIIKEIVVWPMLRPELFTGLCSPPKGVLLFGPPGTGKTLIGKCVASQSNATFFNITASSLMSKWIGEGEKLVRALFAVARCHQPAVIFIDEVDSLLSQRSETEHEASRRLKTEFLVQLDGAATSSEDRLLVIGATNRPHEIDEAARRRFVKRLYIPLPDAVARADIVRKLLKICRKHSLSEVDVDYLAAKTHGYSGADMENLCKEAAMGPIRAITDILNLVLDDLRAVELEDFDEALQVVKPTVNDSDLTLYEDWNRKFGSDRERDSSKKSTMYSSDSVAK